MTVAVRSNFFEDLRVQVVDWSSNIGVELTDPTDLEQSLFDFFSIQRRLVPARPRDVLVSKELEQRSLPDAERRDVDTIAEQVRAGVPLTPRLSRSLLDPLFNDGLLDDWGIHHLHLSRNIGPGDRFVDRGASLLFVKVEPDTAHFIDLRDHGAFAEDELLQIIHDNWPATISGYRFGARSSSPRLSPEERRAARKQFLVPWEASDGTVYLPPGGGATTFVPKRNGKRIRGSSGLSPHVVDAADDLRRRALQAEKWCRNHADRIRDAIAEQAGLHLEELHLRLLLNETQGVLELRILEVQSNTTLPWRFDDLVQITVLLREPT